MPAFGERSKANLAGCHPDLQTVANAAIQRIDFAVIEGHRGQGRQNAMHAEGKSDEEYPHGRHNTWPSLAFDFIFWPFDGSDAAWANDAAFKAVADVIIEEGAKLGIVLLWGGNWKGLNDTDHIQLVSKNGVPYPKTYKTVDP